MNKKIIRMYGVLRQNPQEFVCSVISRIGGWIPDSIYLKIMYRLKMGHSLDLKKPKTFNEKLQWLKLYNRKSIYSKMVDKYAVKEYVSKIIGEQYIIPTLGVWDSFDDIDFSMLPNQFVLKTTHGGGGCGLVICNDKQSFDYEAARKKIRMSLTDDIYKNNREWPYKYVRKRIIAEQYISEKKDKKEHELKDYKFFCFNGRVHYFKIDLGRFDSHRANYYDRENNFMPFGEALFPPDPTCKLEIPSNIKDMIQLADKLSEGQQFLRVDLYNVDEHIYFGELTFFPAGGYGQFTSEEWDQKLGQLIELPN